MHDLLIFTRPTIDSHYQYKIRIPYLRDVDSCFTQILPKFCMDSMVFDRVGFYNLHGRK